MLALRGVLDETLSAAGYTTLCVADGAEAIAAIGDADTDIAAAVIDMMLPNVDGAELYAHIVEALPDHPGGAGRFAGRFSVPERDQQVLALRDEGIRGREAGGCPDPSPRSVPLAR